MSNLTISLYCFIQSRYTKSERHSIWLRSHLGSHPSPWWIQAVWNAKTLFRIAQSNPVCVSWNHIMYAKPNLFNNKDHSHVCPLLLSLQDLPVEGQSDVETACTYPGSLSLGKWKQSEAFTKWQHKLSFSPFCTVALSQNWWLIFSHHSFSLDFRREFHLPSIDLCNIDMYIQTSWLYSL